MTAIATARLTEMGAPLPSMGTAPIAANQLLLRHTIVSLNGSGNAVAPSDGDGFNAYGISNATFDNRTGSEAGGLAGDLDADVCFGVGGFEIDGATPLPGVVLYVVDNQTVSADSDDGARGVAGICVEVRDGQAFVWIGPVTGAIATLLAVIAALDARVVTLENT